MTAAIALVAWLAALVVFAWLSAKAAPLAEPELEALHRAISSFIDAVKKLAFWRSKP